MFQGVEHSHFYGGFQNVPGVMFQGLFQGPGTSWNNQMSPGPETTYFLQEKAVLDEF